MKVKDDVEIEDEPKTNEDLVFEDISLNTALLKSKTQGKNIFILVSNDGTNMDDVLKVLNEDKVFVKNTNDTKNSRGNFVFLWLAYRFVLCIPPIRS